MPGIGIGIALPFGLDLMILVGIGGPYWAPDYWGSDYFPEAYWG